MMVIWFIVMKSRGTFRGIRWDAGTVLQLYGEFSDGSPFTRASGSGELSQGAGCFYMINTFAWHGLDDLACGLFVSIFRAFYVVLEDGQADLYHWKGVVL